MKRVLRNPIYPCLLILSGCGYAFDPESFTFVEAPGTSAGFNIEGWDWPSVSAPTRVGSIGEQGGGNGRSSSGSAESPGNAPSGGSDSSSSQPAGDNADDDDASSGGTSPAPSDDDDNGSGGNTGPSLPGDDGPGRPSIPGDVGGPGLGGGVDPVGDLPPGGGFNGLF